MTAQPTVAGMDGCRGGWLCVWGRADQPASLRAAKLDHPGEIAMLTPVPAVIGVDIPIGLADTAPRACDIAARRRLGRPRGSSVFPAPIRPMLAAADYADACAIGRDRAGRALSRQAWNIVPLIRAMDDFLQQDGEWRKRIYEVHPEASFQAWNGGRAMACNKKRPEGYQERRALIDRDLPGAMAAAEAQLDRGSYARDDLLDAFAAFWSATRIARGDAEAMPEAAERDGCGLRMVIRV